MTQLPYPPIGVALNKGGPPDRAWAVWVLNLYRLLRDADDTSIGDLIDQITSGLYDLPTEPPRRRPLEQELLASPARGEKPTTLVLDDAPARRPEDVRLLNELLDAVIPRKIRSKDLISALASPPPIGSVNPDKAYFDAVLYTTAGYTPTNTIGETYWDAVDNTLAIVRSATHILQVGEEETRKCVNKTGVQIDNGQVVYVSGAQGNRPAISLAKADALSTSMLIGVATENIADNAEGAITIGGALRSYDTSGFTAGDQLYLSTATAGLLTKTPPTTGYLCPVAVALNATNNGMILVAPKCPLALTATLGAGSASNLVAPSQKAVYDAFLSPPTIGSVTPNTSAFTTSTATTSFSAPLFAVNGAAGTSRDVDFRSAGVRRWYLRCNSSAETGSNAGSNLQLTALDDAGNAIDSVFTVNRVAGGTFTMPRPMRFTNTTEVTSATSAGAIFSCGVYVAKTIWGALAHFGGATDYTLFEADGTRVANGAATTFDDVYPSGISLGVGSSAPSFTAYSGNMKAYEFIGTTSVIKEYHLAFQIPHTYKEASTVEPHLHLYIPNDATGGVVKFYCEYTWVSINGAEPSTTTISGTVTVAAGAGNQGNVILSFGNVTGAGKTISSILSCRIYRDPADAADTFAASVWIKSADVHIECDTDGSRTITAK